MSVWGHLRQNGASLSEIEQSDAAGILIEALEDRKKKENTIIECRKSNDIV